MLLQLLNAYAMLLLAQVRQAPTSAYDEAASSCNRLNPHQSRKLASM